MSTPATITTSEISPVVTGAGRNKVTTFTATKVTGPIGNPPIYQSEIIKYDDAKGSNPTTIGSRDPSTGKITWNDNATNRTKLNGSKFEKASTGQINSVKSGLTSNAEETAALNKASGQGNQALGKGDNSATSSVSGNTPPKGGTRNNFGGSTPIVFPEALGSIDRDIIKFNMMEYRPSGLGNAKGGVASMGTRKKGNIIGSVVLPVPAGISDTNTVDWGSGSMDPIQAAMANVAMAGIEKGLQAGGEKAAEAFEEAKNNSEDVKKGLTAALTSAASGIGKQALQRGEGMVLNPNMELLFNGPSLRNFAFTFKLSPRNQKESQAVIQIIRFFKQGMAAIRSESNFFLKAPHTFEIEYRQRGTNGPKNPYLNRFKECALTNCGVQYTPDGNYNTFSDGVMTSYSLQLTFNELEPVFNDDYDTKAPGTQIGY